VPAADLQQRRSPAAGASPRVGKTNALSAGVGSEQVVALSESTSDTTWARKKGGGGTRGRCARRARHPEQGRSETSHLFTNKQST